MSAACRSIRWKRGRSIQLGCFTVRFIKVNHSIPGAFALAITCPIGTVVCSGDFKVDYTPIDGEVTDLTTLAAIGSKGVLALLCESTNVGAPRLHHERAQGGRYLL